MPFIIIIAIIASDQILKFIIRSTLSVGEVLPVIDNFFRLVFVKNTGTAFSMFEGNEWITLGLTTLLIIVCSFYLYKEIRSGKKEKMLIYSLSAIIGGGVSNLIDRVFLGYVTDMFSFGSFAIFNIADIFICCGCLFMLIYILFFFKEDKC